MSDTTYTVGIAFDVEDLNAKLASLRVPKELFGGSKGHIDGIAGRFGEMKAAAGEIGGRLSDAFQGAVEKAADIAMTLGKVGVASAVGALAYGVGSLNVELEQTNLSLAAIFNAQGFTANFVDATRMAADQVSKMKKDVMTLPGDLGQLATIMKTIATTSAQAGMDPDQMRKLSGRAMLFGGIQGIDQDMVARQLAMLLAGNTSQRNILGQRLGFVGAAGSKLKKESGADRYKDINAAFDKYAPAEEAMSHTWLAITTSLKDNIKYSLLGPATSPLFESVKKTIVGINQWFDTNKSAVSIFTGRLGDGLANAWTRGTEVFESWLPAIETFANAAYGRIAGIWTQVAPLVENMAKAIKESLADGSALDKIQDILKLYGAIKIGGAVSSVVSPLVGAATAGIGAAQGAGVAGALGTAGAVLAFGTLTTAALAAAAALGEIHAVGDKSSKVHDKAVAAAEDLSTQWGRLANDMWGHGSTLMGVFDGIGEQATIEAAGWSRMLAELMEKTPGAWLGGDRGKAIDEAAATFKASLKDDVFTRADQNQSLDFSTGSFGQTGAIQENTKALQAKVAANGSGPVTINNYMTISQNESPSRVARVVMQKFAESVRHPLASPYTRDFTSGRQG